MFHFRSLPSMDGLLSISQVNSQNDKSFEDIFGNVIELCKAASIHVKNARPFTDVNSLCSAFYKYLEEISIEEKLEVLRRHPDLAGRLAAHGQLTPESTMEQRSAGLCNITAEQKSLIDTYNTRYKEKFDFPFIICARENKVQSTIVGLQMRYNNTKKQEIEIGLNEVKKICRLRILDIVKD